jgi:nuclear GTP-binding protein
VRLRHSIQKASAAKQKKDRKLGKKNPEWRSKLKKDPGIPNLFPYKDKILAEIEEGRRRKVEDAEKRRADAKATKTGEKTGEQMDREVELKMEGVEEEEILDEEMDEDIDEDANPMAALLASARAAAQQYEDELESGDEMDEDDESESDEDGRPSRCRSLRPRCPRP